MYETAYVKCYCCSYIRPMHNFCSFTSHNTLYIFIIFKVDSTMESTTSTTTILKNASVKIASVATSNAQTSVATTKKNLVTTGLKVSTGTFEFPWSNTMWTNYYIRDGLLNITCSIFILVKIDCPVDYTIDNGNGQCPGVCCPRSGICCIAHWSSACGEYCAKDRCEARIGTWIAKDYMSNPYTCLIGEGNET